MKILTHDDVYTAIADPDDGSFWIHVWPSASFLLVRYLTTQAEAIYKVAADLRLAGAHREDLVLYVPYAIFGDDWDSGTFMGLRVEPALVPNLIIGREVTL